MTIAFTICSINYLAQAHTLGSSLKSTNPDILFFIGLVDKLDGVEFDEQYASEFPLIEVDKIDIENFEEMASRYDITELNTAVKPFYFTYFFEKYLSAQNVIYLDPDIIVFEKLSELEKNLSLHDAVVTPHINTEIQDRLMPNELHHLNTGIYNLGFVAFSRSEATLDYIKWWEEKLRYECYIDLCNGLFTDQNWMTFLPLFLDNIHIERNPGYNAAYWNLHERNFSYENGEYRVNKHFPLIFFHYSGYDPEKPLILSKYQDRFELADRPDLTSLFKKYKDSLTEKGNAYYRTFPCFYIKPKQVLRYQRVRKWARMPIELAISKLRTM